VTDGTSNEELRLRIELQKEILSLQGQIKDLEETMKEIAAGSLEEAQKELDLQKLRGAEIIKRLQLEKTILEQRQDANDDEKKKLQEISKELERQRALVRDQIKAQENRIKLLEKEDRHQQKIRNNILGMVKAEEQRRVKLSEIWKQTQLESKDDARATLMAKLTEASTLAAASIYRTTMQFNSLATAMRQATNTGNELDAAMIQISRDNVSLGVSMENSQRALIALRENFSDMSNMSINAQRELGNFAVKMERAGFDANTTAKFLNNATRSMGVGIEQAKRYQREIFLFGKANGIATKTLSDGLNSVMPKLSAFGKDGIKIFKEMAFQAKNMGMEMNELLGITEKMTTYEGAVEFAGNMNALLGRDAFDTIKVLRQATEDPMALVEDIKTQLQMSGKSFEQLGGQMKRALADAAGTSVENLGGLMKKTSAEMKQAADNEQKFNEAIEKFVPIADKMKALISAMTPAIEKLAGALDWMITLMTKFVQNPFGQAVITLIGGIVMLGSVIAVLYKGFGMIIGIVGLVKTALFGTAAATEATAASSAAASKSIGASMQMMARSFVITMTMLVNGLITLGAEALAGAPAILTLLGVLLGLAVIIGIIAIAIVVVLKSFGELFNIMIKGGEASLIAAESLFVIAGAVGLLGLALNTFGIAALLGIPMFLAFVFMLSQLADEYERIGLAMQFVDKAFTSLEKLTTSITQFEALRDVLAQIAEQMMLISIGSLLFDKMLSNPVLPVIAATMATPKAAENADALINKASSGAIGAKNEASQSSINLKIDTPIMLDGKKLGDWVYETVVQVKSGVDKSLNPNKALTTSAVRDPFKK
jgi:hypothetical protein